MDYCRILEPTMEQLLIIKKNEVGVNCVMKRGDVLFIHRFTPHRGTLNLSNYVRWSIDLRFQKTGTPTGRHFWPEFIAKTAATKYYSK